MAITRTVSHAGTEFFLWDRPGADSVRLRRVVGGVGWPSKGRPGFVVTLGEEEQPHADFPDVRAVHVLREAPDWMGVNFLSVAAILTALADVRRMDCVAGWWGDDRPEFYPELRAHNREQARLRMPPTRVLTPREEITLEWLAMRVHVRTSGQKTMFFHRADKTRAALSALPRDLSGLSWKDSAPEVAALLAAMSALDGREFRAGRGRTGWAPADGVAGY